MCTKQHPRHHSAYTRLPTWIAHIVSLRTAAAASTDIEILGFKNLGKRSLQAWGRAWAFLRPAFCPAVGCLYRQRPPYQTSAPADSPAPRFLPPPFRCCLLLHIHTMESQPPHCTFKRCCLAPESDQWGHRPGLEADHGMSTAISIVSFTYQDSSSYFSGGAAGVTYTAG
jgi:hypothetical protein